MPYNKGDFTQQGVDGKVCGGLLLNNKRDVDVLVSTDEDDSTLNGIAVTVEDHLNDLKYAFFGTDLEAGEVYEIGAGGDSPIVYIKANITDVDANIDLYDYDSTYTYANLSSSYFTDESGTIFSPYFTTTHSRIVSGLTGTGSLVAGKNGGTGEIYFIPYLNEVYKNGQPVPSYAICIQKGLVDAITEVSNVTITDNGYEYVFELTDPTAIGEMNISLKGYIPD